MPTFKKLIPTLLLLPNAISAISLDCSHIRADKVDFHLDKLGGPKTVHKVVYEEGNDLISNTTYTIDICKPLKRREGKKANQDCESGTRICAREWDYRDDTEFFRQKFPIAGEYSNSNGRKMEPKYTRLKGSASNSEEKEGVVVELNGGRKGDRDQKAIIEFLCDKKVSGNEGFSAAEMDMEDVTHYSSMQKRDDKDKDEGPNLPDLDKNKNLQLISYKADGDTDVLRMQWKTKFACEGMSSSGGSDTAGWGFFTWFIIVLFMLAAAYIIFGSWLNYNRYGARGWDLIPHGDTIRDIPYIVKDWGSGAVDRLKGGDTRGGYSAV